MGLFEYFLNQFIVVGEKLLKLSHVIWVLCYSTVNVGVLPTAI